MTRAAVSTNDLPIGERLVYDRRLAADGSGLDGLCSPEPHRRKERVEKPSTRVAGGKSATREMNERTRMERRIRDDPARTARLKEAIALRAPFLIALTAVTNGTFYT